MTIQLVLYNAVCWKTRTYNHKKVKTTTTKIPSLCPFFLDPGNDNSVSMILTRIKGITRTVCVGMYALTHLQGCMFMCVCRQRVDLRDHLLGDAHNGFLRQALSLRPGAHWLR